MRMFLAASLFGLLVGCTGVVDSKNGGGDDDTNIGGPDGGSTQSDAPPVATPKLVAAVDKATVSSALGKTEMLTVTLTGSGDFAGGVTLTPTVTDATGAAVTGWMFTQTPSAVTLEKNGTATVQIAVAIPTDDLALTANVNVAVAATGATVAPLASAFTVDNTYTIVIPNGTGTDATMHNTALPRMTKLHKGAKLVFHNADVISHEIHSDGPGFPHEGGPLAAGADYKVTPTDDDTFYCHDHPNGHVDSILTLLP